MLAFLEAPAGWLAVFGRTHPLVLHLPLGVLPATALLEFGALLLRRTPPRGAVAALACLAAATSLWTAASGLVLAGEGYGSATLGQHKVFGLLLAGLLTLTALLAFRQGRGPFRLGLGLALAAMLPAGHLGGAVTHGADFLWEPLRPRAAALPAAAAGEKPAVPDYAAHVAPLLERLCNRCHNEDKQKGELLLTTPDGIRAGGENGPVLVPGRPDESPLLLRCELPLEHDDHMPPADKPQPSAPELAALRAWIAAGARF
ncbi:MAG: hypothetical protein KF830_13000 [Planctomycetes bacterium]|nr:hypothetical protein [Planctomycetota bacterium]